MKTFLGVALCASLLLNALLLLQRRPDPVPPPSLIRTQIVERVLEPTTPPDGESIPRTLTAPAPEPPAPAPRPVVNLLASPAYVAPGGELTVQVVVASGQSTAKQWVGLYPVHAHVTNHLGYRLMVPAAEPFVFKAPKTAGDYEFRYILEDDRTAVAVSNAIHVLGEPVLPARVELHSPLPVVKRGAELPAMWTLLSGPRTTRDWIGLFAPESGHHEFISWKYVPDLDQGQLTLQAPDKAGVYELRYLLDNGYDCVAVSARVVVVD